MNTCLRAHRNRSKSMAATLSIVVALGILVVKFYAYRITSSTAILSDALESIVNVFAAFFAFMCIRFAAKPPDEKHPLGHDKIEYVAAGVEGFLILIAAVGVFYSGICQIIDPRPLSRLAQGSFLILGTAFANLFLGLYLIWIGKRHSSLTLRADARHVLTDTITSVGIFIGAWLTILTNWFVLDGIIACLMGGWILVMSIGLFKEAMRGLLDSTDPAIQIEIQKILSAYATPGIWAFDQIKVWQISGKAYLRIRMVALVKIDLKTAHDYAHEVEDGLVTHFKGNANILIHIEPAP